MSGASRRGGDRRRGRTHHGCLLADEPTGELDEATSAEVLETLRAVNRELGVTVLIVTHDPAVSEHVRRTVQIRDGRTPTEVLRRRETTSTGRNATSPRSSPSSTGWGHAAATGLREGPELRTGSASRSNPTTPASGPTGRRTRGARPWPGAA
jgi:energy-coupling factor transporter ATP-binding protein EcfA2